MFKKKIFNDPVYGFITIGHDLIFDIIQHPYFQRLRRIKQLGMTDMVYPGALHNRFQHAIGAMHLMGLALNSLRSKNVEINNDEYLACMAAILLHDVGHGPFSHTLEHGLLNNVRHEDLSVLVMQKLDQEFNGALRLAIIIFTNKYKRKFFNQLINGQLDADRLDYLKRDSFFTGVVEGNIGAIRIIEMLNVVDDHLVIEEKGIYSIENFLNARKLMYWQVYLHKTTVSAEKMLNNLIERAKFLTKNRSLKTGSKALDIFLGNEFNITKFTRSEYLDAFLTLDDSDIWSAMKSWQNSDDYILSYISRCLLNRILFKIELSKDIFKKGSIDQVKVNLLHVFNELNEDNVEYMLSYGTLHNAAYEPHGKKIKILTKQGEVLDVTDSSELPGISAMGKIVKKYYLCYPKNVSL